METAAMNRMKELIRQYQSVEFGLTLDTGYYNADTASACNPDEVGRIIQCLQ